MACFARADLKVGTTKRLRVFVSFSSVFVSSWLPTADDSASLRRRGETANLWAQAAGLKYSTIPAPTDASTNPTYSSGLGATFGGWIAIDSSTFTIGAPPKTSGIT